MNCLRYKLGIIGLLFFSFFQNVIGQEKKGYFAEQIIIGTSISRIQDFGNNNPEFIHNEYSWVSNAAISLTKRIHLGFEYKFIRTTGSTTLNSRKPLNFNMYGLFSQIDILESKKIRFFGQLSYDRGNYCGCIKVEDPFIVEGSNYLGWGSGINYRVHEFISFDAAFQYSYVINTRGYSPYPHIYWVLSFNYDLVRSKL